MLECLNNGHYFYPISHLLIPSLLFLFYGNGGWNSAFFAFSLACVWELFEFLLYELFDSYVIFADGNAEETICNVIFLDLGNAILGCILSWMMLRSTSSGVEMPRSWGVIVIIVLLLVAFSFSSDVSWECNSWYNTNCNEKVFPYGNVVCWFILGTICFTVLHGKIAWFTFLNVSVVILPNTLIFLSPYIRDRLSSAVLTYISCGVLYITYGVLWITKKNTYQALSG